MCVCVCVCVCIHVNMYTGIKYAHGICTYLYIYI